MVKVYGSAEELPYVVKPGKYVVDGVEVVVYKPVKSEELVYQLRKNSELMKKFGSRGWI